MDTWVRIAVPPQKQMEEKTEEKEMEEKEVSGTVVAGTTTEEKAEENKEDNHSVKGSREIVGTARNLGIGRMHAGALR